MCLETHAYNISLLYIYLPGIGKLNSLSALKRRPHLQPTVAFMILLAYRLDFVMHLPLLTAYATTAIWTRVGVCFVYIDDILHDCIKNFWRACEAFKSHLRAIAQRRAALNANRISFSFVNKFLTLAMLSPWLGYTQTLTERRKSRTFPNPLTPPVWEVLWD